MPPNKKPPRTVSVKIGWNEYQKIRKLAERRGRQMSLLISVALTMAMKKWASEGLVVEL